MSFRHPLRAARLAARGLIALPLVLVAPHAARAVPGYVLREVTASQTGDGTLYDNGTNVGIGTTSPQSLLHIQSGEVQVGSSGATCAANNAGAIRFSGGTLYFCDGSTNPWQALDSSGGNNVGDYYLATGVATPTSAQGMFGGSSTLGGVLAGYGSTADVTLENSSNTPVLEILDGSTNVVIPSGGQLGVGGTPNYELEVQQTNVGTSGLVMHIDLLTATPVSTSTASYVAADHQAQTASANMSGGFIYGAENLSYNTGTGTLGTAYGGVNAAYNNSTGTISSAFGAKNSAANMSTGTMMSAYGAYNLTTNVSTGTATSAWGSLDRIYNVGTGTITTGISLQADLINQGTMSTWYGLYVPASTGTGSVTSKYPLYIVDTGNSYFAGKVGIGTTAPSYLLHVGSASASGAVAGFQNSADLCTLTPASSSPTWSCSSDVRLKTDIADTGDALVLLDGMRVRDFTMKATGERQTGVIAQELAAAHPDMVRMGGNGFLTVDSPNPWMLVKAIQELKTENDNLRTRVATLEAKAKQR